MQASNLSHSEIRSTVDSVLASTPIWDFHTHLYPPSFGSALGAGVKHDPNGMMLWGIDELLTYHYLIAEVFRVVPATVLPYETFWQMSKTEQADHIWKHLFHERSPLSEGCRGVLTTLGKLGLDPNDKTLTGYRQWFAEQNPDAHTDRIMELANVKRITMTNDPFDDNERERWLADPSVGDDSRFEGVLRFDPLLVDWPDAVAKMQKLGVNVDETFSAKTIENTITFLDEWIGRFKARYCAVSLPPTWSYPAPSDDPIAQAGIEALTKIVIPACQRHGLPFAMMIGVNRGANPSLRAAGDDCEVASVKSVSRLCRDYPEQKFFCTMLARENQHELAITARKFGNLMVFGCWWFLNNPSLIEEITKMRLELLGTSFIPQHSDCRILEQLLYKWEHSRTVIGKVLAEKYEDLATTGWQVTREVIERDAELFLSGLVEQNVAQV